MDTNDNSISKYQHAVSVIKAAILKSQARAAQAITHEQLALYYGIGRYVSQNSPTYVRASWVERFLRNYDKANENFL